MLKYIKCRKIIGGIGKGKITCTNTPINFLSAVDLHTGIVTDPLHDLVGLSIKKTILMFPHAVGSSVGAYSIFALRMNGVAPSGIICTSKVDIITASGCAIAGIPLVQIIDESHMWKSLNGFQGTINANNRVLTIKKFK